MFLRLLAARRRDAALGGKRRVIRRGEVLPASPVVLAAPVGAARLKTGGNCGLFHGAGLHLPAQTCRGRKIADF